MDESCSRPVPFVLMVATEWREVEEMDAGECVLIYRQQAPLTGDLSFTGDKGDVTFSDLVIGP